MKINKILAAGVAATLAVTSLSAVVGAETHTQSYDIYTTKATGTKTISIQAEVNKDIASHLQQNDMQALVLSNIASNFTNINIDSIKMTVSGYQSKSAATITTKEFTFKKDEGKTNGVVNNSLSKDKWRIVVLDKKTPVYHDGEFASFYFDTITSLKLDVTVKGDTISQDIYNTWSADKYLTIGQVDYYAVNANTAASTAKIDTYGTATPATPGTTATTDKAKVIAAAAAEVVAPVTEAAAADLGVTAGKGLLIGTKVLAGGAGAVIPGSEIIATQALYTTTTTNVNTYGAAGAANVPLSGAVTAVANETEVTAKNPVIIGTTLYQTGYIYATAASDLIYVPTKLTDAQKTTIGALVAGKLISDVTAAAPGAIVSLAATAAPSLVASAVTTPLIQEVNKDDYDHIVADAVSSAAVIAAAANNAVILSADGTKAKLSSVDVYGQAFTTYRYDPNANSVTPLLAYAFANGGWYTTKAVYGDTDSAQKYKPDSTTEKLNAWLPCTTDQVIAGVRTAEDHEGKTTITRYDVDVLSETNDYHSTNGANWTGTWANPNREQDNQTYEEEMIKGTRPLGFAGLASQVANFFNKQDNGKITFTFTSQAAAGATSAWSMGIPSTEVGLIGSGAGSVTANFALFFNYNTTGGMMLSKAKADLTKGTVEFDISDYLAQSGTLTMATLHDIYYGLNVGYKYNNWTNVYGMYVSKVELSYDDAPAADADAAAAEDDAVVADDDDAAAVVDADDDDDDDDTALIEDDDDDDDDDATIIADDDDDDTDDDDIAAVITDDDEDDTAAAGTVDVVTPAAQDSNPATGVGLAVIPAIVAAAAMAISKKRK